MKIKWPTLLLTALLLYPGIVLADAKHGGQAIDVQGYHLELLAEPEAKSTHLHFYLMDGKDQLLTNAQVRLQVTMPDGTKKTLALGYSDKEKSYVADLPFNAKGTYNVVALTTIGGKKLNARYTFRI